VVRRPDLEFERARVRRADYDDLHHHRSCATCSHYLAAPKGGTGLCEEVRASLRPSQVCDRFVRRGSSEVNST